jgi:hypothetical protein
MSRRPTRHFNQVVRTPYGTFRRGGSILMRYVVLALNAELTNDTAGQTASQWGWASDLEKAQSYARRAARALPGSAIVVYGLDGKLAYQPPEPSMAPRAGTVLAPQTPTNLIGGRDSLVTALRKALAAARAAEAVHTMLGEPEPGCPCDRTCQAREGQMHDRPVVWDGRPETFWDALAAHPEALRIERQARVPHFRLGGGFGRFVPDKE